jgi:hypothetical protein
MAKHIEDIGKDAKDLLTESYPIDGTLKITTQTKSGGFTPKITLNRYTVKREKGAAREIVTAGFEPKYEIKQHNLELNGKLASTNDFSVGSSVRDVIGEGSKLEVNLTRTDRDGLNGSATASYQSEAVAVKTKLIYPLSPNKATKLNSEVVYHHRASNINIGVGVDLTVEEAAHIYPVAVMGLSINDTQYKGFVRYDLYSSYLNWGFSYWQKLSNTCRFAIDIFSEDNSAKTSFNTGYECKVDDNTTVKGKCKVSKTKDRLDYRVGASLKQKLSPSVIAIIGADLNPRSFLGSSDGEPHSFGLEIKFQD